MTWEVLTIDNRVDSSKATVLLVSGHLVLTLVNPKRRNTKCKYYNKKGKRKHPKSKSAKYKKT